MSRIINTAKVLRRNWKKSTFFFGVLAYGASYFKDKFQTHEMMRAYCEEARKYGEKPLTQANRPKHVTVILNPKANYEKANVQFEKFAAPLLHLAGFKVSIFQTEHEKQAKDLMQVMSNTDAVLVAGGNGTLHEAVTGLMLRPNLEENTIPLGIVPLGKTNTIAEYLFGDKSSSRAQLMAEAVMAVIRETTIELDVLKVQYLDEDQPVYAMCNFEQGIFADVNLLVEKYWYLGGLKERFTYFIKSLKEWHPIENKLLEYVEPCAGCSKCYVATTQKEQAEVPNRWWHAFVPRTTATKVVAPADPNAEYLSTRINENCGKRIELSSEYSTISVATTSVDSSRTEKTGSFAIKIFPKELSMTQFISSGLSHRKSKQVDPTGIAHVVDARELIIEVDSPLPAKIPEENGTQVEQTLNSDGPNLVVPKVSELPNSDAPSLVVPTVAELPNSEHTEPLHIDNVQSSNIEDIEASALSCVDSIVDSVAASAENSSLGVDLMVSNGSDSSTLEDTRFPSEDVVRSDSIQAADVESEKAHLEDNSSPVESGSEQQLTEAVSTSEAETAKSSEEMEKFSYIDQEKYRRASCKISILPKKVTIFG